MPHENSAQPRLNTAGMLVKCLENEGVEYVFGVPGEENLELIEALSKSSIKFITTRHEQGAAFMADVYGRLTHKAGVCLSTLGPGATNLVTGVADAYSDGAPLVAITGQVGTERMHLVSHQFLDLCRMFAPITKKSEQIVLPDTVSEIVRIAFKTAESEKPGSCHIDLPVNVSKMPVSSKEAPLQKKVVPVEMPDANSVEDAAFQLMAAKRPVILAGSGAVRNSAGNALLQFVNKLHIPLIHTMMAKGIIPFDNPYCMWTVGIPQKDYANKVLEDADLVLAVGYDLVEYSPARWNGEKNKPIVHIDTLPANIDKCYQPKVEVVGDISVSLLGILSRIDKPFDCAFALDIKRMMEDEYSHYVNDESFPMLPQRILSDVRKALAPDDILISDVGAHKMWIARQYHCYKPNTCLISNGFASMGFSLPGAIAAKLVYPEKRVLAVAGDGGFLMNCQELETAVRLKTAIVVLIFHDDSYGLIKWKQMDQYGHSSGVDFHNPDFVKFSESFGAKGYRVQNADQLSDILRDAFSQTVPCVIDCPVDYGENVKLTRHLKEVNNSL